jgi:outer membrane protein assembly factor BamE
MTPILTFSGTGRRCLRLTALLLLLPLASCMHFVTRQGNVLKEAQVANVQIGDSRFDVETAIGTPVLKDILHPNRSIYVEDYSNPKTGEKFLRRVEITYDASDRVQNITISGFKKDTPETGDSQTKE